MEISDSIKHFSDKCLFCGHRIKVSLKSEHINGKMAFILKLYAWRIHKIKCEAQYWSAHGTSEVVKENK